MERVAGTAALAGIITVVAIAIVTNGQDPTEPATTLTPATRSSTESRTAVTLQEPVVDEVGRRLLGITADWEVFARGLGEVVRIEPAQGRITRTAVPGLDSTGPVSFLVGPDRALVRPLDAVPGYVVPDGQPARELPRILDGGGPIFSGPMPDQVWIGATNHEAMTLVTLDGRSTGQSIPMPAGEFWPIASDGNGYVLVDGIGGAYLLQPAGLRRVTTGALLAVGPNHYLTLECDERARCSRSVIDRVTGNRRGLGGSARLENLGLTGAISPDGSMAAVLRAGSRGQHNVHLIDLASGARKPLEVAVGLNGEHDIAWSPDSRWLFIAHEDLLAVDTRTERIRHLYVELPPVTQVAVRNPTGS